MHSLPPHVRSSVTSNVINWIISPSAATLHSILCFSTAQEHAPSVYREDFVKGLHYSIRHRRVGSVELASEIHQYMDLRIESKDLESIYVSGKVIEFLESNFKVRSGTEKVCVGCEKNEEKEI